LLRRFELFKNVINDFLSENKAFTYDDDGTFRFTHSNRAVPMEHLSSGEKHLIAILGYLCTSNNDSSVFIADEPEISLHLEWQRKILPAVKILSPNTQVIVATHSPSIISDDSLQIDIEDCYSYE
ncbi:AAA family ATPase, partial [Vibrio antiquarius]|uniref:AAA family ATPase n=1 Tax=Vibrio antiquarius (strain Ex25) TaxID=150340 RepID=UPI00265B6F2D